MTRRWGRKWLVAGAALIVVVATLAYIVRFTPLVPDQIARTFSENLLRERGYRLQIATVRGNPLGDLVLTGTRLIAERAPEREVARVREMEVRVHPLNLLRGRVDVRSLKLVEPYVHLGGDGIRADLLSSGAQGPRAPMPLVRVRSLEIEAGHVDWARDDAGTVRAQSLNGRFDLTLDSRHVELRIEDLSGQCEPYAEIERARGRLVWAGDSLVCEDLDIETPMSRLELAGFWKPDENRSRWTGAATPLDIDELDPFYELPVRGRLQGPLTLSAAGQQLDFAGTWSGTYADYAARDVELELRVSPDVFELQRAFGYVGEHPVDLQLRLAGEQLRGSVRLERFDCQSLGSGLPRTQLTGRAGFRRNRASDALRLDVKLGRSHLDRWPVESVDARIAVRGTGIVIDSVVVRAPNGVVRLEGTVLDRALDLTWKGQMHDLATLVEPLGAEALHGWVKVEKGTLSGDVRTPALRSSGDFSNVSAGPLRAASGSFTFETDDLSGGAPLRCSLRGKQLEVAGRSLARFSSQLEWTQDGVLRVQRAQAVRGDTLVAVVAELHRPRRDWNGVARQVRQLRLETALLQAGVQEARVEDPATVWWSDAQVRVDSLRVVTRRGSMRLDGAVDFDAALIDARTEVHEFGLDFVGQAMRLESTLSGIATGWVEAHGSLDRTLLDARLGVRDGRWNSLDFDSARVHLQSDAFGVELRTLDLTTPHGNVSGSGRLAYLPGLRRWLSAQEGSRSREELFAAQVSARLDSREVVLERFWQAARPDEVPAWGAVMSARAALSGTVGAPLLTSEGRAQRVRVLGHAVDSLRFEVHYEDGELGVPMFDVSAAGARLTTRGRFPLQLHLVQGMRLHRERPLEAHLRIDDGSFAVVPHFISFFEPATRDVPVGRIRARLDVSGSAQNPELRGDVVVEGAGFTLAHLAEIYRDANMIGVFEGETLRITDMRARSGEKGEVRGSGYVVFDGLKVSDYRFALGAERLEIYSVPQVTAKLGGQIDVRARSLQGNGALVPDVRGTLHVAEANITQEFASGDGEPSELLESTDQPEWLMDVTLDAPGRVRVQNSNADAELSGQVQLVRNRSGFDVQGQAQVKRGYYTVYLERFDITGGYLDFSRRSGWEPQLDIRAQRGRLGDRIYVNLTGTPSEPNLVFTGDAPGTADDYQDRLIGGDRDLASDAASVASAVATQALADLSFIDSFSIDPESPGIASASGDVHSYVMSTAFEVHDGVFVTYRQGISETDRRSVAIELDLLRNLLLQSSWEHRNFPTLENQPDATQDAFDLDLKFRWEW